MLPIVLSSCHRLLILAGPAAFSSLRCVVELFIFLRAGGSLGQITLIPLPEEGESLDTTDAQQQHALQTAAGGNWRQPSGRWPQPSQGLAQK